MVEGNFRKTQDKHRHSYTQWLIQCYQSQVPQAALTQIHSCFLKELFILWVEHLSTRLSKLQSQTPLLVIPIPFIFHFSSHTILNARDYSSDPSSQCIPPHLPPLLPTPQSCSSWDLPENPPPPDLTLFRGSHLFFAIMPRLPGLLPSLFMGLEN